MQYPFSLSNYARARLSLALTLSLVVACRRSYPVGALSVRVLDANNAPVTGVAVDLYKITPKGRVYWRASRTGGDGTAVLGRKGGVIEGEYIIHVGLLAFQELAPGGTNDRPLRLRAGDDTVLTFRVVPRRPVRLAPPLPP